MATWCVCERGKECCRGWGGGGERRGLMWVLGVGEGSSWTELNVE